MATKTTKTSPNQTPSAGSDRQGKIDAAVDQIQKKYGEGSLIRLGSRPQIKIATIQSGALSLDIALGGGIPLGRIIEIYGPESSGKTTLSLHAIAELQKTDRTAAFIDAEHALDPIYAQKIGVNIDDLLLSQPDNGEQALAIVEDLVASGNVDLIVIDSVAALTPKAEIDGKISDNQVGLQARLMSKAMRKLTALIGKHQCSVIFINQLRMKIGVMFGSPEVTTGGNALKFYASVRLDIRRLGQIKVADQVVGNRVRVRVVKNKLAPPFTTAEFDIMYNEGISLTGDVLDLATDMALIDKAGAWYSYQEQKIAQGRQAAKQFLKDNPKILADLEDQIRQSLD